VAAVTASRDQARRHILEMLDEPDLLGKDGLAELHARHS
jgi:hypothetical protein